MERIIDSASLKKRKKSKIHDEPNQETAACIDLEVNPRSEHKK